MSYEENMATSITSGDTEIEVLAIVGGPDAELQAELEELWAKRRAEESAELTANEAANYARHHAIIERDENGNPIETEPKE